MQPDQRTIEFIKRQREGRLGDQILKNIELLAATGLVSFREEAFDKSKFEGKADYRCVKSEEVSLKLIRKTSLQGPNIAALTSLISIRPCGNTRANRSSGSAKPMKRRF